MDIIIGIREKVAAGFYEYSKHAVNESILRKLSVEEIRYAILSDLELLEDYPDDHYGPSCLVFGFTKAMRPIHLVMSYPTRQMVKIITVYEPDPLDWTNHRIRKARSIS